MMVEKSRAEEMRRLAEAGRAAIRRLWKDRAKKDLFAPQEQRLLALLEQHEHFREYWEGKEPSEESNPFLHIHFHEVIEKQISEENPPETRQTLDRLVAGGVDPHEARHRIAEVLVHQLYARLNPPIGVSPPEDPAASYRAALAKLAP